MISIDLAKNEGKLWRVHGDELYVGSVYYNKFIALRVHLTKHRATLHLGVYGRHKETVTHLANTTTMLT